MDNQGQQAIDLQQFWHEASTILERVVTSQAEAIRLAATLCAESLVNDGVLHAYGTGHSRAFAMELAGRAGGLVPVNRIDLADLALYAGWSLERVTQDDIERDLAAGEQILACYRIEPHDCFIISSQSGINAAVVEVAQRIKAHGHALIAVTALDHTQQATPRHPSGKKLYELADVIIDSCSPFGDALLSLPNGGKACAISSLSGALIGQMLTAEIINALLARGIDPPVYISYNVPGGIERGEQLRQQYLGRIR